ncbi:hypothetical protein [Amycolatopsis camponoti]|uniref:hypothetical protein n=1 Tax=Amycolatopsis camponoti TaxID=2606593 RepID=UPI0012D772BE|nr:hypothetical protein [Amycolatopsis camponoti]
MCEVDYVTEFGARDPGTITCRMICSRLAGFDGDFLTRIDEADAAARALGWLEGGSVLRSSVEYYRITEAEAGKVDAGTVPGVSYLVPGPAPGTTGCNSPGYLGESWVERSADLSGRFGEWPSGGALFERASGPRPQATAADLLSRHRYVMTFTLGTECRLKVGWQRTARSTGTRPARGRRAPAPAAPVRRASP